MKILLDSACLDDIRYYSEYYPIIGVTTNPSLLSKEAADPVAHLKEIRSIIGDGRELHIQATAKECAAIVEEARLISSYFGKNTFVKIPFCDEGLKATAILAKEGIKVTETAILTAGQAMLAANAGAANVAIFVSRLENSMADGIETVADTATAFANGETDTKIIAASFKTSLEVLRVALAGAEIATVSPAVMKFFAAHSLNTAAIESFRNDWSKAYGNATMKELIEKAK